MLKKGITFIELLTTISILIILAVMGLSAFFSFQKKADFSKDFLQIKESLKLAQSRALSSEGDSKWGVYFASSQYTIFKGSDYASRDVLFDESFLLQKAEIITADFQGEREVVFKKVSGAPDNEGKILLELNNEQKAIIVEKNGKIETATSTASDLDRIKDSRHVHIEYSRAIDTISEKLILTFDEGTVQEIVIADNLNGGQILWKGEIEVLGETQIIEIKTHRLNSPDTQFCIHRDRRFNTRGFSLDIDGDPNYPLSSPILIEYLADGSVNEGSCASSTKWQ